MDSLADVRQDGTCMIYGHTMRDETLLDPLRNYRRKKLFRENNVLHSG